jgi:hypothetical protein
MRFVREVFPQVYAQIASHSAARTIRPTRDEDDDAGTRHHGVSDPSGQARDQCRCTRRGRSRHYSLC